MDYLKGLGFTDNEIETLKIKLNDEEFKKIEFFPRIVKENFDYLNNMGISNMKDAFINHVSMFLKNPDRFKSIFVKYDQADLVRCIEKNHNVIEKL